MATLKQGNAVVEVNRDWSNLPIDIIGNVIKKLFWAGRIRFRAVCKSWQVPLGRIPASEEYPWLLSFADEKNKRVIKLLDPYRKKNYVVNEFRGDVTKIVSGFFWNTRYGWIIVNKGRNLPGNGFILSTFLFCPFTKELITEFPDLKIELEMSIFPLTGFFINPASPECVVYAVWRRSDWVLMATCSPGDTEWKFYRFSLPGFGNFLPYGVMYLRGSFYCITTGLDVGVFNLANQEWKLLIPSGQMPRYYTNKSYHGAILHSDVDLLWYECKSKDGTGGYSSSKVANVWRFDLEKNCWVKKKKLGNRTVFSSSATSFSVSAAGKGKGRDLVGMVFSDDGYVSVIGENKVPSEGCWNYAEFYNWMVKESKPKSKNVWSMWVDPRPVWKKSDLVKHCEVSAPSNI